MIIISNHLFIWQGKKPDLAIPLFVNFSRVSNVYNLNFPGIIKKGYILSKLSHVKAGSWYSQEPIFCSLSLSMTISWESDARHLAMRRAGRAGLYRMAQWWTTRPSLRHSRSLGSKTEPSLCSVSTDKKDLSSLLASRLDIRVKSCEVRNCVGGYKSKSAGSQWKSNIYICRILILVSSGLF